MHLVLFVLSTTMQLQPGLSTAMHLQVVLSTALVSVSLHLTEASRERNAQSGSELALVLSHGVQLSARCAEPLA